MASIKRDKVLKYLNGNPSSRSKIKEETDITDKYLDELCRQGYLDSIGPHRYKIYYLKKDQELARKTLNDNLQKREDKLIEQENLVYQTIIEKGPIKLKELCQKIDLSAYIISETVRDLLREGTLGEERMHGKSGSSRVYTSHEIFDGITGKRYLYAIGVQDEKIVDLIVNALPPKESLTTGKRKALTHHLKSSISRPEIFKEVHEQYFGYIAEKK